MSRIQQVLVSRLRRLSDSISESSSISHSATKGALRESYLRAFLGDIMPPDISVGSGFICDCFGSISPQIDFILAERKRIPSIALMKDVALVPVETALAAIEMKSTVDSETLDQLKNQFIECQKLRPVAVRKPNDVAKQTRQSLPILFSLIGLETKVGKETLSEWFQEIPHLMTICIIGKFTLKRKGYDNSNKVDLIEGPEYLETLTYFSVLINVCYDNITHKEKITEGKGFERSWIPYIVGPGKI
ncbi:MAG: hypothetical protein ISS65_01915 [Desulfobacterales bacterium]|uniref:DUF6602 domain-containing protein n=1 Tax=Candidatus Desulfatibia profunda TaxID=2841695 RepID=A0A8J6TGJ6_9BACT|nr:hypothetical protein [Candidatus Desulfatibia profunda]MBL7178950.1 hypothetical protein [Desulfobacterales bacterium]